MGRAWSYTLPQIANTQVSSCVLTGTTGGQAHLQSERFWHATWDRPAANQGMTWLLKPYYSWTPTSRIAKVLAVQLAVRLPVTQLSSSEPVQDACRPALVSCALCVLACVVRAHRCSV